jgi:hypothetical protein
MQVRGADGSRLPTRLTSLPPFRLPPLRSFLSVYTWWWSRHLTSVDVLHRPSAHRVNLPVDAALVPAVCARHAGSDRHCDGGGGPHLPRDHRQRHRLRCSAASAATEEQEPRDAARAQAAVVPCARWATV